MCWQTYLVRTSLPGGEYNLQLLLQYHFNILKTTSLAHLWGIVYNMFHKPVLGIRVRIQLAPWIWARIRNAVRIQLIKYWRQKPKFTTTANFQRQLRYKQIV
jgi:hypothetical protein